jgi:hypothetical protein
MQGQNQFAYNDLLAGLCGSDVPPLPRWRAELNRITGTCKRERPEDYRDADLAAVVLEAADVLNEASTDIRHQVEHLTGLRGGSLDSDTAQRSGDAGGAAPGDTVPHTDLVRSSP